MLLQYLKNSSICFGYLSELCSSTVEFTAIKYDNLACSKEATMVIIFSVASRCAVKVPALFLFHASASLWLFLDMFCCSSGCGQNKTHGGEEEMDGIPKRNRTQLWMWRRRGKDICWDVTISESAAPWFDWLHGLRTGRQLSSDRKMAGGGESFAVLRCACALE